MSAVNIINAKTDLAQGVQMVRLGRLFAANDKAAHTINVRVLNDGSVADLTGQTISAYFIRPDNATVTVQGTLSGNVASVTLPSSCYANSGHFSLIIKAVSTNTTTAIFWGDGTITRSTTDTIVDPENIIPSLEELLAQIEVMEQGTAAATAAAESANTAASSANTAATAADTAATAIQTLTVEASNLTPGSTATATVSTVDSHKHIAFGIPIGHTPNLTIGTVQTLGEDSSATASITGTQTAPVLNLGIPRGRTGSAENVFASNTPMSSTDQTTIKDRIEADEAAVRAVANGGTGASTAAGARQNLQTVKTNQTDDSVSVNKSTYTPDGTEDTATRLDVEYAVDANNKTTIHGDESGVWLEKIEAGVSRAVPNSIEVGGTGADNVTDAISNFGLSGVGQYFDTRGNYSSFPASSTPSNVATLVLDAGVYVVTGYISLAGTTNGSGSNRIVEARIRVGAADFYAQRTFSTNAGAVTQLCITGVVRVTETTNVVLRAFSTTAVTTSSDYKFIAVRII